MLIMNEETDVNAFIVDCYQTPNNLIKLYILEILLDIKLQYNKLHCFVDQKQEKI